MYTLTTPLVVPLFVRIQIVMSLKVATVNGARTVGAAFADVTSRQLGVAEFADNDLFSNTEVRLLCHLVYIPLRDVALMAL